MMLKSGKEIAVYGNTFPFLSFGKRSWVIVLFLLLTAPIFASFLNLSGEEKVYPLCVMFLMISIWIACTIKYISRDILNLYSLFMLAAVLFNGGQALLEVFHMNEVGLLMDRFHPGTQSETLYLVMLSLVSFHAGGILSTGNKMKNKMDINHDDYPPAVSAQALHIIGCVLLIISCVPVGILALDALEIVMWGGYSALYQQERATGLIAGLEGVTHFLAGFFVTGCLFLLVGTKDNKKIQLSTIGLLLFYAGIFFFLGHRRYGTMIFLSVVWIWHVIIRPLSLRKLTVIGLLLLFFVFPTINLIRNIEGGDRLSYKYLVEAFLSIESPIIMAISEMGGSMGTIAYTLHLIPDERPFAMGTTYLYVATSIIPNLFWGLHPAIEYGSLARWLTITVDPFAFLSGGGLGYSFIAEAYANFGWWGAPVLLALLGFAIAKLTSWPKGRDDYARIAFVAVCIATILLWVRGDANIIFRPLIYYALMPYWAVCFVRSRLLRKRKG